MTFPWDGADHDIDSQPPMKIAMKRINTSTVEFTIKVAGTVVELGRATVSPDGKTNTTTFKRSDGKGRMLDNTEIYEKQ